VGLRLAPLRSVKTFVAIVAVLAGCHREPEKQPPPAAEPAQPKPPLRDAVGDRDLRAMLAELAASKACDMMRGSFRPLRAPDRRDTVTGTLWIRDCSITANGTKVQFHLGGRGWQWSDQVQHKAGGTFAVREYVKFEMSTTIPGAIDIAYDRGDHVVSLWFSPDRVPDVDFTPAVKIEVDRKGLWSSVIGGVSSAFASSPEKQAKGQAKKQGTRELENQLADGLTFALNLCTGLSRFGLGRAPKGQLGPPDVVETDRVPVEIQPGGVMIFGPQLAPKGMSMSVDVKGAASVAYVCDDDAAKIADAYAQNLPQPAVKTLAELRGSGRLVMPAAKCRVAIVARASAPSTLELQRPLTEIARSTGGPLIHCK
jgi:hypothetical protein